MDDDLEQLCDELDLETSDAERILEWHHRKNRESAREQTSTQLRIIVGALIWPGNLRVRALALAFAMGMNRLTGYQSLREASRMTGFSTAWISREQRRWIELLGLANPVNSKSVATRKKLSDTQKAHHWRKNYEPRPRENK